MILTPIETIREIRKMESTLKRLGNASNEHGVSILRIAESRAISVILDSAMGRAVTDLGLNYLNAIDAGDKRVA